MKTQKQYLSVVLFFLFICVALLRAVPLTWSCLAKKEHSRFPPQHVKQQVFKIRLGTYIPPPPPSRGPH